VRGNKKALDLLRIAARSGKLLSRGKRKKTTTAFAKKSGTRGPAQYREIKEKRKLRKKKGKNQRAS